MTRISNEHTSPELLGSTQQVGSYLFVGFLAFEQVASWSVLEKDCDLDIHGTKGFAGAMVG